MSPDMFKRFRSLTLVRQQLEIHEDLLTIREWRRDPVSRTIIQGFFCADTYLTLSNAVARSMVTRGHPAPDIGGKIP